MKKRSSTRSESWKMLLFEYQKEGKGLMEESEKEHCACRAGGDIDLVENICTSFRRLAPPIPSRVGYRVLMLEKGVSAFHLLAKVEIDAVTSRMRHKDIYRGIDNVEIQLNHRLILEFVQAHVQFTVR